MQITLKSIILLQNQSWLSVDMPYSNQNNSCEPLMGVCLQFSSYKGIFRCNSPSYKKGNRLNNLQISLQIFYEEQLKINIKMPVLRYPSTFLSLHSSNFLNSLYVKQSYSTGSSDNMHCGLRKRYINASSWRWCYKVLFQKSWPRTIYTRISKWVLRNANLESYLQFTEQNH